ncbi:hypothetical protein [Bacillus sp. FJAT-50079]|uniref:hypothetical protein n=1 Tax=Bacillus sp. FJAT-50079 TaxID=2833577 RepID=UPI001BC9CD4D|nr:hypothetical protein [Bacillus sp. FJAT-50079]MBS4210452.1 hypothetical protein [Bacillus sp. FJAT-50079]
MKKKKYMIGGVITGLAFSGVLVFNSLIFPSVLAATSNDSGIKTKPASTIEQDVASKEITDSSNELSQLGITEGIPEKIALGIAIDALKDTKDVSSLPYDIKLAEDNTPVDPIKWFVTFYDDNDGYSATINPYSGELITLEQFSGVRQTLSIDVEEAKAEKAKLHELYHKTIYSIYDKE